MGRGALQALGEHGGLFLLLVSARAACRFSSATHSRVVTRALQYPRTGRLMGQLGTTTNTETPQVRLNQSSTHVQYMRQLRTSRVCLFSSPSYRLRRRRWIKPRDREAGCREWITAQLLARATAPPHARGLQPKCYNKCRNVTFRPKCLNPVLVKALQKLQIYRFFWPILKNLKSPQKPQKGATVALSSKSSKARADNPAQSSKLLLRTPRTPGTQKL